MSEFVPKLTGIIEEYSNVIIRIRFGITSRSGTKQHYAVDIVPVYPVKRFAQLDECGIVGQRSGSHGTFSKLG